MTFYKRTTFWSSIIKTLALFGPGGGAAIGTYVDNKFWYGFGLACLALSAALSIWMVDKDNNGLVDILEKKKK